MKPLNNRCPWCGKKIEMGNSFGTRLKYGLAPVHQCRECSNPFSSFVSILLLLPITYLAIRFYFLNISYAEFYLAVTVSVIFLGIGIVILAMGAVRYKKMGNDGKNIHEKMPTYTGTVKGGRVAEIKKGAVLLTSQAFDEAEAFTTSSPIKVLKYSPDSGKIKFSCFYENEETKNLLLAKNFEVFFDNGRKDMDAIYVMLD